MGISFQQALGVHPQAVKLRLERTELLTANLANVDTPNFKAKDIDFAREMQRANNAAGWMSSTARADAAVGRWQHRGTEHRTGAVFTK